MKIKELIKSYSFWTALSGAVIVVVGAVGRAFGFSVEGKIISDIIMGIAGLLVVFGIVSMPKPTDIMEPTNTTTKETIEKTKATDEKVTKATDEKTTKVTAGKVTKATAGKATDEKVTVGKKTAEKVRKATDEKGTVEKTTFSEKRTDGEVGETDEGGGED